MSRRIKVARTEESCAVQDVFLEAFEIEIDYRSDV